MSKQSADSQASKNLLLSEKEVFDLVCDYLSTKGLLETEKTLRDEFGRCVSSSSSSNNQSSGSRLEDLLEKSYITQMVSGNEAYTPRDGAGKRKRSNLDAILSIREEPAQERIDPAALDKLQVGFVTVLAHY